MLRFVLAVSLMAATPAVAVEWVVSTLETNQEPTLTAYVQDAPAGLFVYCDDGVISFLYQVGPEAIDVPLNALKTFQFSFGAERLEITMKNVVAGGMFVTQSEKANPLSYTLSSNQWRNVVISETTGTLPRRTLALRHAKEAIAEVTNKCM